MILTHEEILQQILVARMLSNISNYWRKELNLLFIPFCSIPYIVKSFMLLYFILRYFWPWPPKLLTPSSSISCLDPPIRTISLTFSSTTSIHLNFGHPLTFSLWHHNFLASCCRWPWWFNWPIQEFCYCILKIFFGFPSFYSKQLLPLFGF